MSHYDPGCEDCVRCDDCDEVAYCLSEPGTRPCGHDRQLCGDCNVDGCTDCRLEAEMNMYRSGEYDPDADPLYNPAAKALDAAYWARGPREEDAGVFRWTDDGGAA